MDSDTRFRGPIEPEAVQLSELIQSALTGNEIAAYEIDSLFRPRIRRFYGSRLADANDIDDLAQITMTKALTRLDQYQADTNFSAWLYSIAENSLRDWLRRRQRTSARALNGDDELSLASRDSTPAETIGEELFELARAVLSPNQYQLIWLVYVEQQPIADLSRFLKRSPVALRVQLFRAKRKLAKAWRTMKR